MSAFIISRDTMHHVVSYIRHCSCEQFAGMNTRDSDKIGRALYEMNLNAVTQRYPENTKETAPRPIDISNIHENYHWLPANVTQLQQHKSIGCLLYQSSEGNVPETSSLFKELDELHNALAHDIISNLPAYRQTQWDA